MTQSQKRAQRKYVSKEEVKKKRVIYMQNYRKRHPDYCSRQNSAQKEYYHNLRLEVMELLGGAQCINCGCSEKSILEINHKRGGGRQQIKKLKSRRIYCEIKKDENRKEKYEITCRVCNALHYVRDILKIKGHRVSWETHVL